MKHEDDKLPTPRKSKEVSFQLKANESQGFSFFPKEGSNATSLIPELKKLTGIDNDELMIELISIAGAGMPGKKDFASILNVSAQILSECSPQDLHESRLCLQANNLFSQGMYYLDKANRSACPTAEFYMKSAIKLLRLHNETVETLHRYRRKGEQKVIVQHVNVNEGGQAIVGHIDTGGGGKSKMEEPHG